MQRRWVWSIAVAVILLTVGIFAVNDDGGGSETLHLDRVGSPRGAAGDESSSTSTGNVTDQNAAATPSTTAASVPQSSATTAVTRPRSGVAPASTTPPPKGEPTPTPATQPRRWVTVMTLSRDFGDSQRADSSRFQLLTGKARIVLDAFEVGNEDARLFWHIMGSEPYTSEAHGVCEGPPTTSSPPPQPGAPATTAPPPSTSPTCESGYEAGFDIEPESYFLRVDSTHSEWTARIQELR